MNWTKSTHIGKAESSLLSLSIQMLVSSENTLEDPHSELMFFQLSGHPLAQSGEHIKLAITLRNRHDLEYDKQMSLQLFASDDVSHGLVLTVQRMRKWI
jgi:hypothetical protein